MIKKHIAIVEDDTEIRQMLGEYLSNQGFQISLFENGLLLMEAISEHKFRCDLIVLDIMMPQLDGLETCRRIRRDDNQVPIIMLTSVAEDVDRIIGLEVGADDYVTKPFNIRELLARIKVILKRTNVNIPLACKVLHKRTTYAFNRCVLDASGYYFISASGEVMAMTSALYELLKVFLAHPNIVLHREKILTLLGDHTLDTLDRSIDVKISRLRQILSKADPKNVNVIKTIRGGGYKFDAEVIFSSSMVEV